MEAARKTPSWDSSVGIATGHAMDGGGSPFHRVQGKNSLGQGGRGVNLTTYLHLMPRSRMVELYLYSSACLHAKVLNY
jgi:hypothetical protein